MKKKIIISVISILIILSIWLFTSGRILGKKPFKSLNTSDISKVTVVARPPNTTALIEDRDQIETIADTLKTVVIYERDDSGRDYSGQLVQFILHMKDGSTIEVGAYNPFIFIDDKCYKTKYEPCEELNSLGNELIK